MLSKQHLSVFFDKFKTIRKIPTFVFVNADFKKRPLSRCLCTVDLPVVGSGSQSAAESSCFQNCRQLGTPHLQKEKMFIYCLFIQLQESSNSAHLKHHSRASFAIRELPLVFVLSRPQPVRRLYPTHPPQPHPQSEDKCKNYVRISL